MPKRKDPTPPDELAEPRSANSQIPRSGKKGVKTVRRPLGTDPKDLVDDPPEELTEKQQITEEVTGKTLERDPDGLYESRQNPATLRKWRRMKTMAEVKEELGRVYNWLRTNKSFDRARKKEPINSSRANSMVNALSRLADIFKHEDELALRVSDQVLLNRISELEKQMEEIAEIAQTGQAPPPPTVAKGNGDGDTTH